MMLEFQTLTNLKLPASEGVSHPANARGAGLHGLLADRQNEQTFSENMQPPISYQYHIIYEIHPNES